MCCTILNIFTSPQTSAMISFIFIIRGDMTYRSKSFSIREDDSRAPQFSPHTMSIQQVRPFGLGGFGVFSSYFSLSSILNYLERIFYFSKKKKKCDVIQTCWYKNHTLIRYFDVLKFCGIRTTH